MDDLIPFSPQTDFSTFRLEQTKFGHVVSPKFTFELSVDEMCEPYGYGSRYHQLARASKDAFAEILKIDPKDVIVSQHYDQAEMKLWWRLGTKHRCALPAPKKKALPPDMQGAIEI